MVGFLRDSTIEEEDLNQQQPLKLENSDDPLPLDFSFSELDDFSLSFVDSILDFDSLTDWIQENPVLEMDDSKPADTEKVDSVKMDDKGMMDKDGSCGETNFGDGFQKLGDLGSSIEEDIGKVSLDGLVVAESGVMSDQPASVGGNGAKSVEIVGVDENVVKSSETLGIINESGSKNAEIVTIDGDGPKSDETESDGHESGSSEDTDSSSSSASSSSSSSSSEEEDDEDDDDEEEGEGTEEQKKEGEIDMEEGEIRDSEVVAWSEDEDDEEDGSVTKGPIRSKNELEVLPPVPPVKVTLQPHHQILPVGVILSIVGTQVIVEGVEKHNPLNEGSILWITESRSPLGLVDEIFGPVKNPYYIIRYNSENEVPAGVEQGTSISFVREFAQHVLNDSSLYKKGYDASGENDEELSEEAEFSDDEKEAEYKRMLKMTKRGSNDPKVGNNRKKDRKKFKNHGRTWQNSRPSTPQTQEGVHQPPTNQNQRCAPRPAASLDNGSCSYSFGTGQQGFASSPSLVPLFPQLVQAPGFIPTSSGVWTNGMMPCEQQQQQNMVFHNGVPTNGMPWTQQNQFQQSYQMPLPNRMPFQQQMQFVPSQSLPPNMVFPAAQPNFCTGPAFAPWPGSLGQSDGFNQPSGMGLQCQQAPISRNVGEQPRQPPMSINVGEQQRQAPMSMNVGQQPRPLIPGNIEVSQPQQFNQGMHRGCGSKPYHHRGGGRFGGGRGRNKSK